MVGVRRSLWRRPDFNRWWLRAQPREIAGSVLTAPGGEDVRCVALWGLSAHAPQGVAEARENVPEIAVADTKVVADETCNEPAMLAQRKRCHA